jgi:hypothetical protein
VTIHSKHKQELLTTNIIYTINKNRLQNEVYFKHKSYGTAR